MIQLEHTGGGRVRTSVWVVGAVFVGVFAALLLTNVPAARADAIDFNRTNINGSGSISFAGDANSLVGTNILFDTLTLPFGVVNCGNLASPCLLNFTTGAFTGTGGGVGWFFAGGGTISLTGSIPALALPNVTLLTGTFSNAAVIDVGGILKVTAAGFADTKNPAILAAFGLPPGQQFDGALNLSFLAPGAPGAAFASLQVFSGDVVNIPVPEPAAATLLASSVLPALVFAVSRRRRS